MAPEPPPPGMGPHDYADAFVVHLDGPDDHAGEEWMRVGLEQAPWVSRTVVRLAWRGLLGFRLAPPGRPGHLLGWRVVASEPDEVVLETSSRILRAVLVGRRPTPDTTMVTLYLQYLRPLRARAVWAVVGPVHRALVPRLLRRVARVMARS